MNQLFMFKLGATVLILLAAFLGGIWPLRQRYKDQLNFYSLDKLNSIMEFSSGEAIAAGIFFAAGLLHMLPDSAREFSNHGYPYLIAFLLTAIIFLLLLGCEHLAGYFETKKIYLLASMAILTSVMLIIHSLLEGLAVGISQSFSIAFVVFLAIITHKSAASFALSSTLCRSKLSMTAIWLLFGIFACMTSLGILIGSYINVSDNSLLPAVFTALAAGTFIYMGTLHGLKRASLIHRCCNLKEFFLMLAGFSVMALTAFWA